MNEGKPDATRGMKNDAGKQRWDLLPWASLVEAVKVLTFGGAKYADDNWQHVECPHDRYFAAAQRHLVAWRQGEWSDAESGHPHLAHAVCCVMFLLWFGLHERKGTTCEPPRAEERHAQTLRWGAPPFNGRFPPRPT